MFEGTLEFNEMSAAPNGSNPLYYVSSLAFELDITCELKKGANFLPYGGYKKIDAVTTLTQGL